MLLYKDLCFYSKSNSKPEFSLRKRLRDNISIHHRIACKLIRHISRSDSGYLWRHNVTISLLSIQTIIDTSYQFSLSFLSAVIMMSSKAEFNFVKIAKFEELPCHETAQHVILRPITSSEETNLTFHYWDRTAGGDQGEKDFLLILHFIKLEMKFALKVVIIYLCSVGRPFL